MDFVGCLLFSFYKIEELVLKTQGDTVSPKNYQDITINLIVEDFYMPRSKEIFKRIFGTLVSLNPNVKFNFIEAENSVSIPFLSNIKIKSTIKKFMKDLILIHKQGITSPFMNLLKTLANEDRVIRELFLLYLVIFDINTYGLRLPEDFRKYLTFLPEYRELFGGDSEYKFSWYMIAVKALREGTNTEL
jgi:hypothetical protein